MTENEFLPFRDRQDAGRRLAQELVGLHVQDPVVLAIPRGGVVVGAELATILGAELDIVVARKLRVPMQPELAFGAIGEDGTQVLDHHLIESVGLSHQQIAAERVLQTEQIKRRVEMFRAIKPEVNIENRTVILTDDGIATGSTMMAALKIVRAKRPLELIVAVPVAPPNQVKLLSTHCDRLICLHSPSDFVAVGEFYEVFEAVEDPVVEGLLRGSFGRVESHRR